jgi:hypothetical protein
VEGTATLRLPRFALRWNSREDPLVEPDDEATLRDSLVREPDDEATLRDSLSSEDEDELDFLLLDFLFDFPIMYPTPPPTASAATGTTQPDIELFFWKEGVGLGAAVVGAAALGAGDPPPPPPPPEPPPLPPLKDLGGTLASKLTVLGLAIAEVELETWACCAFRATASAFIAEA